MKKFLKSLLSSENDTSSKRFAALFTLLNILAFSWIATLNAKDKVIPEFMFDALALVVGGGLGLTVIEKIFIKYSARDGNEITPDQDKTENK